MVTSVNYPSPIFVNGYLCHNCTDVDYAKKNIDPNHPKDGPFGVNAPKLAKPAVGVQAPGAAQAGGVSAIGVNPAGQSVAASSAPSSNSPGGRPGGRVNLLV
jgi:hypothetical protein